MADDFPAKSASNSSRSNPEQNVPSRPRITITADVVVLLGAIDCVLELGQELLANGVPLVRPIQQMWATCPTTSNWIGSTSVATGITPSRLVDLK